MPRFDVGFSWHGRIIVNAENEDDALGKVTDMSYHQPNRLRKNAQFECTDVETPSEVK
jgi:hypothetical protein